MHYAQGVWNWRSGSLSFFILALRDRAITYIITVERGDKVGVETC